MKYRWISKPLIFPYFEVSFKRGAVGGKTLIFQKRMLQVAVVTPHCVMVVLPTFLFERRPSQNQRKHWQLTHYLDLIWMTKRRGATSDNDFIFKRIHNWKLEYKREKEILWQFWRAVLTGHGQSSQLADFWKTAKMALFNSCMELEFRGPNDFIWIV